MKTCTRTQSSLQAVHSTCGFKGAEQGQEGHELGPLQVPRETIWRL